jgi:hypothetical protein
LKTASDRTFPMRIRHFYLALLAFFLFFGLVLAEYFLCGVYFRLIRPSDSLRLDAACLLGSPLLCYWAFHRLLKKALQERIPHGVITVFFLICTALLGFFLRFTVQLANGGLDPSGPEEHLVIITDKRISSFGGSIQEGLNPMAHLVYFHDNWEPGDEKCALWTPDDFYFSVDVGGILQLSVRRGLLRMPWVEDFQALDTRILPRAEGGWGEGRAFF